LRKAKRRADGPHCGSGFWSYRALRAVSFNKSMNLTGVRGGGPLGRRAAARRGQAPAGYRQDVRRTVMKLENFRLRDPSGCVEIIAAGMNWDLHNCVDFLGLVWHAHRDELWMEWIALPQYPTPWGDRTNRAHACRLRFSGLKDVQMRGCEADLDLRESSCLSEIAKVIPGEREYPLKDKWTPDEPFNLRFTFEDERVVTIDARRADLEAVNIADLWLKR
jgi:hypothetical protein